MFVVALLSFTYCFLYLNFSFRKEMTLIPFFVLFALIGTMFWSKDLRGWFSLLLLALSYFIFILVFRIMGSKEKVLTIITLSFFLFSLCFIFYFRYKILHFNSETRLGPPFDNQNGVSTYSAIGFSTALYLLLFSKRKYRFLMIVPILTSLIVGVCTGSRTFYISIPVFIFVFLFFKFRNHKKVFLIVSASIIALFIIFLCMPFMESFRNRLIVSFQTLFGKADKVDYATLTRAVYIDYGFYLGSKKLLFGYGVNGFYIFSGVGTYAHSNYSEVLCDFGIIGFILFYLPLIVLLIRSIKNKKIEKPLIVSFFIYYFLISFTNVLYYKKAYYLVIALLYYFAYFDENLFIKKPVCNKIERVVLTCDTMGSGGAEKVIASLSNQMANQGIQVTIIGVADFKEPKSFYKLDDGVVYNSLIYRISNKKCPIKRVFVLRKTIKAINPDVVISFLPNANIYTFLSLILTKIPFIVSERNNPYIDPKRKIMRMFKMFSFYCSSGSVFQTNEAKQFYPKRIQDKATIIKNPVSLHSNYHFCNIRSKTVLSVGRLVEQKNHKCLLRAFAIFNHMQNNTYKLKIFGEGPLKEELKQYCCDLGISTYVSFLGNNSEWHISETNDSMFVLSSDYEGMPNSLIEAMALGIPSIATDCPTGGPRELINDSINGFLVNVNNHVEMAEKMSQIIKPETAALFSANNEQLSQKYCPERITQAWIQYIKCLSKEMYE